MNATSSQADELAECAQRLEAVARCSMAFLHEQLQELERMGESVIAQQRGQVAAGPENGQSEGDWLRQKSLDEERIEEQLEHLQKAWNELEVEQRRLMMLGDTGNSGAASNAKPAANETQNRPRQSLDLIETTAPMGAASAALQFQKLKREIRQQSRRQR